MSEWTEYRLADFMDFNPVTPLSKDAEYKKVAMENLGINSKKVLGWEFAKFNGGAKFINGDTLVAKITPCLENGKLGFVDFLKDGEVGFGSTEFIVLREKTGISIQQYIYYFAFWNEFRNLAVQLMTGTSGRQRVETDVLKQRVFRFPEIQTQQAIAAVLSSLDDKIDLLSRQNTTLEALAQTYFRQLIVEGADVGWEETTIGDMFDVFLGGTPSRVESSYWDNGTIGWINSGKVNEFRILSPSEMITEKGLRNSAAKLLPAGTTVIAITGATLGQISRIERPFAANQSVIGIMPKAKLSNEFVYYWIKTNMEELISRQTGGAQQHINSDDVKSFWVIVPSDDVLKRLESIMNPLSEKITANTFSLETLQKLRDTLLPKLISGEVRVKQ
jgi:type I restriction enzyme S subunit